MIRSTRNGTYGPLKSAIPGSCMAGRSVPASSAFLTVRKRCLTFATGKMRCWAGILVKLQSTLSRRPRIALFFDKLAVADLLR